MHAIARRPIRYPSTYCPDELELLLNGRRVVLAHGDGWQPTEHAYRMMKRVFRSRWAMALFRLLSPDLGFPLANLVSGTSRGRHDLRPEVLTTYAGIARQRLATGTDLLVTAHLHAMVHRIWPEGEWLVTGDWVHHFSYAMIDDQGAKLLQWNENGVPQLFTPDRISTHAKAG